MCLHNGCNVILLKTKNNVNTMNETLRFFIGIAVFLAVFTFEWAKSRTGERSPEADA